MVKRRFPSSLIMTDKELEVLPMLDRLGLLVDSLNSTLVRMYKANDQDKEIYACMRHLLPIAISLQGHVMRLGSIAITRMPAYWYDASVLSQVDIEAIRSRADDTTNSLLAEIIAIDAKIRQICT
jgi:hypothetical protein